MAALPILTKDPRLPDLVHSLLLEVHEQLSALHARMARRDTKIAAHAKHSAAAQRRFLSSVTSLLPENGCP